MAEKQSELIKLCIITLLKYKKVKIKQNKSYK